MRSPTLLSSIQAQLRQGQITLKDLVHQYLEKINQSKAHNIYTEVFESEVLLAARKLDERYKQDQNSVGRLFGAVLSIKDVLCYKDHKVSAGSRMLQGFQSLFTATAIQRLLDEDALIIGRVNCDEFAMGSSNENSFYGPVQNPLNPERIPGGSSGGSAAAVAAHTCLASIGSDTGGSVRQPAAFCGVVGWKPSYGAISRHGLIAYASSFDQIGLIGQSAQDLALLTSIMAGQDAFDSTVSANTWDHLYPISKEKNPVKKIAWVPAMVDHPGVDPEIQNRTLAALNAWKLTGHKVEPVEFPLLDYIIPAYYVLTTAEASSNLARYDGVRYGFRAEHADDLESLYRKTRTQGFGREVKRRIMLGTFVLSAGYFDAYYSQAQKVRRLLVQKLDEIFEFYDFLALPVSPVGPWKIGEKQDDPVSVYLSDIFTVLANLAGGPAISFPIPDQPEGDIPVSIQLMGPRFSEASLLEFVHAQELT